MLLSELKTNPKNPRLIKDARFKKLVQSIQDFPQMMELRPIIVDEHNMILGGNMRFKALQQLKMEEVPDSWVKQASALSEAEKQEFIIKDNVGFGENDWDILANEWDQDQLIEWGMEIPPFAFHKDATEDDYVIPDEIKTDILLGDLFEIGQHRLLCGDSTDPDLVAKLMNGQLADMIFTDPPYGVDYDGGHATEKRREKLKGDKTTDLYQPCCLMAYKFSIENAPLYLWHAGVKGIAAAAALAAINAGYEIRCEIVWNKQMAQFGAIGAQYKQKHEPCYYCYKKGKKANWIGSTNQVTVWDFDRSSKNEHHPTQKPIALANKAILNHSVGLILDLFLGSGSTTVAAHQLNRKCYGMEIDPKYCQVIVDRMLKLDPAIEIKKNGKTYKTPKNPVANNHT